MKNWLLLILFLSCSYVITAQKLNHVLGEMIIQTNTSAPSFAQRSTRDWSIKEVISTDLNVYLISFDYGKVDEHELFNKLIRLDFIDYVQFNNIIEQRGTTPNDPLYGDQWQYFNTGADGGVPDADLDAELAWDITTGGVTANGDTIVVCIVDSGIEWNHPDFEDNLWINYAEIPDNGLDDDDNGLVDDYYGWNFEHNTPDFTIHKHGTSVAGVIGAKGNNNIGVSGVNWDVKMMILQGSDTEAHFLKAYDYAYSMRKKYNQTKGTDGAFIVVVNSSFGTDATHAEEKPIWCGFYNKLGEVGILSAAATANNDYNVEIVGDMPTTCTSDYLIAVTNLAKDNKKIQIAGYGHKSVDLGAYGEGTFTVRKDSTYGSFSGTSAATPHVAGTIALLYAAACPNFSYFALREPGIMALEAKSYILNGVVPNESLNGITTTGGVLNMKNALDELVGDCESCPPPVGITIKHLTDVIADIYWVEAQNSTEVTFQWKEASSEEWIVEENATSPFHLTNLTKCVSYDIQLVSKCDGETGDSEIITFETEGCCKNPDQVQILASNIHEHSVIIQWVDVFAATDYTISYKQKYGGDWKEETTDFPFFTINSLLSCTDYFVKIRTNCADETIDFGSDYEFSTIGCTSCTEPEYCKAGRNKDQDNSEWIEKVMIGEKTFTTGLDLTGFGDYTGYFFVLEPGKTYPITITPGFANLVYKEYSKMWIDWNNDGDMDDGGETVYDQGTESKEPAEGFISVPQNAALGGTRLRVSMAYHGDENPEPTPCLTYDYGEAEDYCVIIADLSKQPLDVDTIWVGWDKINLNWGRIIESDSYSFEYKESSSSIWQTATSENNAYLIKNLTGCTDYDIRVAANYAEVKGAYSDVLHVKTDCTVENLDINDSDIIEIYPNPFNDYFNVNLNSDIDANVEVYLYNVFGQLVLKEQKYMNDGVIILDQVSDLSHGIYWVEIRNGNQKWFGKVLKI